MMAAPANDDVRELERLLVIAADSGEPRSFASLREELALGHEDLQRALDVLREHGKASEVEPGVWSGEADDLGDGAKGEPERVLVSVGDAEAVETPAPRDGPAYLGIADDEAMGPTVRLTFAIATALDPAVLGQLVKAGIDDAVRRDEAFVLEVLP